MSYTFATHLHKKGIPALLSSQLCFLPRSAAPGNKNCTMASEDGQLAIFNTADLLFSIPEEDRQGKRTMLGILSACKLASLTELMQTVGVMHVT